MSTRQSNVIVGRLQHIEPHTIYCYVDSELSDWTSRFVLTRERSLVAQALQLLI